MELNIKLIGTYDPPGVASFMRFVCVLWEILLIVIWEARGKKDNSKMDFF